MLWDNESRVIDAECAAGSRRSSTPTSRSPAYHLALDAHPEVGNNALLARELGVEVEGPFAERRRRRPLRRSRVETFLARVRERIDPEPLVFADGPDAVERVAIVSGGAAQAPGRGRRRRATTST